MKKRNHERLLKLVDYETKTSRFMFLWLSLEEAVEISSRQSISFGRRPEEKSFWQQSRKNDLIVFLAFDDNHIKRYAFVVVAKGIQVSDPSFFPVEKPYLLFLKQVGFGERASVKGDAFFQTNILPYASRPIFQEVWEECNAVDNPTGPITEANYSLDTEFEIRIASSHEDYNYIATASAYHPFGPKRASVTLVATENHALIGAILLDPSYESNRYHRAEVRLFRSDYPWIRERAVHIARIYSSPFISNKWRLHRALLKSAIVIAPSLVTEPISILQGVSYDYHPVAPHLGFNVEVPRKLEGSFYYWREFNVPPRLSSRTGVRRNTKEVHALLRLRKRINYWLAIGRADLIQLAMEKNAWALHRYPTNTGRWRQLEPAHIVFLMSEDKRVRAYGSVSSTSIRNERGLERYPLWIDFKVDMARNLDVDISQHISERWFEGLNAGGLIPLPDEFGAQLKSTADHLKAEGKMWVEPNPYLLHQTEFQVTPRQIFVVQSWTLGERVLPVIRDVLSAAGYSVKFAGDREGQVVFEVIWQLLNESEVVLVDFTDRKPNVYLEYGMALVLGKPIVAITQDQADIPSDTLNLKYIVYRNELGDTALRKLPIAVQDTIHAVQSIKERKVSKL